MVRYGVQNTNDRIQRRERNRVNRSSSIVDDDEDNDEVDNIQRYLHPINARNTSSISDEFTDDDERERENSCDSYVEDSFQQSTIDKKETKNYSSVVIVAVIFSIIGVIYMFYLHNNRQNQNIYDESKFYSDIDYLCKNYKINYNSIMQIQSVISTTFRKEDAASLIFTYNSANSNFNPANFNQFMNDLAFTTARYLRNDNNIHNHVIVDSTKLDMKVHSELIERYRNDVTKTGVMLVTDLDEVPSSLAMAFHYYCDEFNPLVKKSAILFTLNMAKCSDPKITHASVEKCLAKKWTIIPKDNIVPLLTRIVNVVIDVTNVI
ncbi:PREDICTED: uncharacterized protein LOC106117371 isoform X2 [Papilio xuthus]|uniref:Uncharacterized protein LOC106117371 isoform X2 n=1 Tax=Papilio xuthus TaxID=66420 RepID=A0AAJ6Z898_PAPXU|nr:PREDICTED: uncharacterized protein LOC106117371 isoform X2 [Papilio xuthus]